MGEDKSPEQNNGIPGVPEVVKRLKDQLDEFEKLREGIRASIESATRLVPNLEREKKMLEEDVHEKGEKIAQVKTLILRLEKEKEKLQEDVDQKQEQISKIDDQIKMISLAKSYDKV